MDSVTRNNTRMARLFFILSLFSPELVLGGYPPSYYPAKNPYLPAPPGKTPSCAKNGATYCDKIDGYPSEVISYLLYKWAHTYDQFVKSESEQDFFLMSQTYGPSTYDLYETKKPQYSHVQSYYPSPSYSNNYNTNVSSSYNIHRHHRHSSQQQQNYVAAAIPPLLHSIWWNHRDTGTNRPSYGYLAQHRFRVKRQTTSESQLCPTRATFITPQAAMNNEGNWMYVVNTGNSNRYIQKVKAETCAQGDGRPCNGLCSVPTGYSATCRQQYVQKRLVALDGSGESLRNDVFWFAHCCTCQVTLRR